MKFKDYLFDSPQRMEGNAPFEEVSFNKITDISEKGIKLDYDAVKSNFITVKGDTLDLYKSKSHPYYVLGRFYKETEEKNRFAVIFDLSLVKNKINSVHKLLKNKNIERIDVVHTASDYRYNKIATKVYTAILSNSVIVSDKLQYQGAVELWKTFIESSDFTVYIYDIVKDKFITKVTKNTHENSIWSDDLSKQRIRLVCISN